LYHQYLEPGLGQPPLVHALLPREAHLRLEPSDARSDADAALPVAQHPREPGESVADDGLAVEPEPEGMGGQRELGHETVQPLDFQLQRHNAR
jgi:hypothetical protein